MDHEQTTRDTVSYKCESCGRYYKTLLKLEMHAEAQHSGLKEGECPLCHTQLASRLALSTHFRTCKAENQFRATLHRRISGITVRTVNRNHQNRLSCHLCYKKDFKNKNQLNKHIRTVHATHNVNLTATNVAHDSPFVTEQTAHNRFLQTFSADVSYMNTVNISELIDTMLHHLIGLLEAVYDSMQGAYKVFVSLYVSFTDVKSDEVKTGFLLTKLRPIYSKESAADDAAQILNEILNQEAERAKSDIVGSQWVLKSLEKLFVNVSKYTSFKGGARRSNSVQLPRMVTQKGCLGYVRAKDHCLLHCISMSGVLGKTKSRNLISSESLESWSPETKISDLATVESALIIGINVFGFDDAHRYVFPVRISQMSGMISKDDVQEDKIVNVFFFNSHFFWIKNFNRFAGSKGKKNNKYCYFCLSGFNDVASCRSHMIVCREHDPIAVTLPPRAKNGMKPIMKFTNFNKLFWQPFVGYADFECLLKPVTTDTDRTSSTRQILHRHDAFAYAYVILDQDGMIAHEDMFMLTGNDREGEEDKNSSPAAHMLCSLFGVYAKIAEKNSEFHPLMSSAEVERQFQQESICHICKETMSTDEKVRDHDHATGIYRGAAHLSCNFQYRPSEWLSIFIHNNTNYDAHIIVKALSHPSVKSQLHDVTVMPISAEKYTTISITTKNGVKIRFVDSLRFLNASLESLATSLVKDSSLFLLESKFPDTHQLLRGKQHLPYEHLQSLDVLLEQSLPPRSAFHNSLSDSTISQESYDDACNVYSANNCASLGEYVKLYLLVDVILLAEIFQHFRKLCYKVYSLDPSHFISLPQLALDAALLKTKINLELLVDIDQILFVRDGIRGGLCMISNRYAKANNSLMGEYYDRNKEDKYLGYFDVTNLYGFAMLQPLPVANFAWCKENEFENIMKIIMDVDPFEADIGFILQVDIDYPEELHDCHNDLPLAPEKLYVTEDQLSSFVKENQVGARPKTKKLLTHFYKRDYYIVHHAALKYYVSEGLIVTQVHKIMKFTQKRWLADYIMMNTKLRSLCNSSFEKDMYKLFNNSIYGKALENIWNRKEVNICWDASQLLRYANRPWFRSFKIVDSDLSLFVMKKKRVFVNKPLYMGFSILEISKVMFYRNYYDGFKTIWPGNQSKLLMVDTDSYILEVTTSTGRTMYDDLFDYVQKSCSGSDNHLSLDRSSYDEMDEDDSIRRLHSQENARTIGSVKDETGSTLLIEFVGLRPKTYAIKTLSRPALTSSEILKGKGVPRHVLKSYNFDVYLNMLQNSVASITATITCIRSEQHSINTIISQKRCLSIADDKRFICADNISSLAYGHKKLLGSMTESSQHDDQQ